MTECLLSSCQEYICIYLNECIHESKYMFVCLDEAVSKQMVNIANDRYRNRHMCVLTYTSPTLNALVSFISLQFTLFYTLFAICINIFRCIYIYIFTFTYKYIYRITWKKYRSNGSNRTRKVTDILSTQNSTSTLTFLSLDRSWLLFTTYNSDFGVFSRLKVFHYQVLIDSSNR